MVRHPRLTREEIRKALSEWLRTFKGYETGEFKDSLDIILDYGLDSMDGVELACDLSTRLGIEIPAKDNPLIHDDPATGRRRSRNFGEVVDYLVNLAAN